MKVKDLIKELHEYNQEADVFVVAHYKEYPFTLAYGNAEGVEKSNCQDVNFYVINYAQMKHLNLKLKS